LSLFLSFSRSLSFWESVEVERVVSGVHQGLQVDRGVGAIWIFTCSLPYSFCLSVCQSICLSVSGQFFYFCLDKVRGSFRWVDGWSLAGCTREKKERKEKKEKKDPSTNAEILLARSPTHLKRRRS
jgi:hypothetical protein